MKKSSCITQLITATFLSSLIMIACKKEQSGSLSPSEEEQAANYSTQSETENEVVYDDVFDNVMGVNTEVGIGGTGIFGQRSITYGEEIIAGAQGTDTVPACVTITITRLAPPAAFPVKIVMDFGTGC